MQRAAILVSQTNLEGVELSLSESFSFALINYITPGHAGENALQVRSLILAVCDSPARSSVVRAPGPVSG